jgi:SSS family solute:Na+ symporter
MVMSAIMITPFAFLWIVPGLAAKVLYPGLITGELAVPTLITHLIPSGALGLVVCGFLASGFSTIGSNLGAVATLISNDIYGRFIKKDASPQQLVVAARIATLMAGLLMILITCLIPYLGGTVDAYLTIISIVDMPLFVIAIVYGLLWKKATWQGAMAAYATGAIAGAVLRFGLNFDVALVTLISGGVALVVCPIVSVMTEDNRTGILDFQRFDISEQSARSNRLVPFIANTGTWILGVGFLIFLAGVFMGSQSVPYASTVAIVGMLIYFAGGALRARAV